MNCGAHTLSALYFSYGYIVINNVTNSFHEEHKKLILRNFVERVKRKKIQKLGRVW